MEKAAVREIRSSKAEIRKKPEIRMPKDGRTCAAILHRVQTRRRKKAFHGSRIVGRFVNGKMKSAAGDTADLVVMPDQEAREACCGQECPRAGRGRDANCLSFVPTGG